MDAPNIDAEVSPPPGNQTLCVACRLAIHPEATRCPHCGSLQAPGRWRVVSSVLKWVGGTTAVVSLVLAAWQLDSILSQRRERAATVTRLIGAARIQQEANDLSGAWNTLEHVLEIAPTSWDVRRAQTSLAMRQVREIWRRGPGDKAAPADHFLLALFSGATDSNPDVAANSLAHLGWVSFLREDLGTDTATEYYYRKALDLDPDNVYAHAMLGHWILWPPNVSGPRDVDRALTHFDAARATGLEMDLVENLAIDALLRQADRYPGALLALVNRAHAQRSRPRKRPHGRMSLYLRSLLQRLLLSPLERDEEKVLTRLLSESSPQALRETYIWLASSHGSPNATDRFVEARLLELEGRTPDALALYRQVAREEHGAHEQARNAAARALSRLAR